MKIPFRKALSRAASSLLEKKGYKLVPTRRLYEWQLHPVFSGGFRSGSLPAGADRDLSPDNPRLLELQRRYALFNPEVTKPLLWTDDSVPPDDLRFFRGDNAYVWQLRGRDLNPLSYALTTYYAQSNDPLGLLAKVGEDEAFGVFTFDVAGRTVSRDLLDSINELNFLHRELAIGEWSGLNILDIGAGYGRLAHRAVVGLPNLGRFLCTDAVATSTFLAEYYLRFRGVESRAEAVPLDEIEQRLTTTRVDLAVNIHSFSECRTSAVDWWLKLLARYAVRFLLVVPNIVRNGTPNSVPGSNQAGRGLINHTGEDFSAIIQAHGYRLRTIAPKYSDPSVQSYGVQSTYYHLFERV